MNKKYEFDTNDAMNVFASFICDMIAKYGDQIDFDSLYSPYELRMRKIWKKISVMYQTAALSRTLK